RSVPGEVEGRREDAEAVARPGRQDLTRPDPILPPAAGSHWPAAPSRAQRPGHPPPIPDHGAIAMLDADLKAQLAAYMEKLQQPIELVASLDDSDKSRELGELLRDIASTSDRISIRDGDDPRKPSFAIVRAGTDVQGRFAGIPMGHEFTSLVLALLQVGGHPVKIDEEPADQVRDLEGEFVFETYMSLSCQSCPDTVQALNAMSVLNSNIRHVAIDGALYQDEVEAREVMSVPTVFLNGEPFDQGRMTIEQIVAKLDTGAAAKAAAKIA